MSQQDFNELRDALAGTATAGDSDHGVKATAAETAYNKFKSYLTKDQQAAIGGAIQDYKTGPATKTLAIAINTAFTTLATPIAVAANQDETTGSANPLTAVKAIDEALKRIADDRANLGATLNRLDFNVNNLKSQSSAMASAASQIEDADMAKEMSEMTKFKILNEAGISMLSQANQTPQMVSKLLQ